MKKEKKNRIKKATFNSKNGFYLFFLAGAYACGSDDNSISSENGSSFTFISSVNFVGSDLIDFLGDTSSTSNQIVDAGGGNDVIITGDGDDVVRGGQGSDFISTGEGNDTILIVGTTAVDEYSLAEIETTLLGVLFFETLNTNIVDEAASDIIDGGDGIDTLVIYGATDLTGTTITNIENIIVHSTVTVDADTFGGSSVVLRGDGSSVLVIEGDVSLTDVLGGVGDFSGFAGLEIGDGATVTVTSLDEVNLLAEIGIVSGSGTLIINGTETLNLAEVTVVAGLTVNKSHTNLSDVSIIDGTFSLEQGSTTNINTDGVNLAGASTTTTGFNIDENGQLLITDTSMIGKQLVSIDIGGVIVRYTIVLPKLDIAPTQADFDGITFDELDEGANLNFTDALSTALPNLDPVFVLTKATANNGTVNDFSYNSGEFSGTETITFTLMNVVTSEEFDFTVDLGITAVNDEGIIQITGNRQQGETLTAGLIDLDGGITVVTYTWSQGAISGDESSFDITSSMTPIELTITYRDAVNPSTDQTATITIAAEDILVENIDTKITLNLDGASTSGTVTLEDSNNSDSFAGLTSGNPVNIATTLAYTTATISLVDDGSGGEQINFEYIIDRGHFGYIVLAEGEESVDLIALTTTEGVSIIREFTVVGENDIASFSSGNVLTVNDSSGLDQGIAETQNYVIADDDGTEQEDLVQNFGVVATSGTLDGEVIASVDLVAYGNLNVNPLTNELSFLKGEEVDTLVENEVVVLTFFVESIDQTPLIVTVIVNGGNEAPTIVNEEVTIAEDSSLVVISVLDNDSDVEGDDLTVTEVTGANNGTVRINEQNQLEYIVDSDFFGTETLTYTVSDGTSAQSGTVIVSIMPVNDQGILVVAGAVVRGLSLSVTLTDVDGIDGSDVTLSFVDGNGELIEGFTPVIVEGSGSTVTTTLVVPTSVAVGSAIILLASYTDSGGVAYGTSAPLITRRLIVEENMPPTIGGIIPTNITVSEDTPSNIDLSLGDFSDVESDDLLVTLTASAGTFTAISSGEVTVDGSGTKELTLFGSTSDINIYLDTISNIKYTGVTNVNGEGAASFTIVVNDGFLDSVVRTVNLDISSVNDAPTIGGTVPTDITVTEDMVSHLDLSLVELADIDSDNLTVSLIADSGIFTVKSTGEVTVDGSGSEVLTLTGSTSELNNYLDVTSNIEYTGETNVNGEGTASFTIVVNDGSIDSVVRTVNLDISPVNDAPIIGGIVPTDITVTEDTASPVDLSAVVFSDIDSDDLVVTLTASVGTFTATSSGGVTVDGSGTNGLTLSGRTSDINAYLDITSSIKYTGMTNDSGEDAAVFTITVNDGMLDSNTGTVNLHITGVNDKAEITGDSTGIAEITNVPVLLNVTVVTTSTEDDFRSVGNLVDGDITIDNYSTTGNLGDFWTTDLSEDDYFVMEENPVLMVDFGSTQILDTILVWGQGFEENGISAHSIREFTVEILNSEGNFVDEGSFDFDNIGALDAFSTGIALEISLSQSYTTSQVRIIITDNYAGLAQELSYIRDVGGSRVGLGELAFANLNDTFITGDLNHIDVDFDNTDDLWEVVETPTASIEGYGNYTINATGNWIYTVNNNNVADAVSAGQELTDTFIAVTEDGTTQVVTVTIKNPLFSTEANGVDTLMGERGNNVEGLDEVDTLRGSANIDRFVYTDIDIGSSNIDTIRDFVSGEDKIDLSTINNLASSPTLATVISTIEEGATLTDDLLAYTNAGTTTLYIDANNDGLFNAANDIQIEFSNDVSLVIGDFIF